MDRKKYLKVSYNKNKDFYQVFYSNSFYDISQKSKNAKIIRKYDKTEFDLSTISRAKSKIKEICVCNNFTHFGTITFSDKSGYVDSTYFLENKIKEVIHYFNNEKIKYLLIAERGGIRGRLHLHCLIDKTNHISRGKNHFIKFGNGESYCINAHFLKKYGRNSFVEIYDNGVNLGLYLGKYLTKMFCEKLTKRSYYCSKNFNKYDVITLENEIAKETHKKINDYFCDNGIKFYSNLEKKSCIYNLDKTMFEQLF